MRTSIFVGAIVALTSGCDSKAPKTAEMGADPQVETTRVCTPSAKREVAVTSSNAQDRLEAQLIGEDCQTASLLLTLRKAGGHLLWAYAVRAEDTWAFAPADDNKPVDSKRAIDAFITAVLTDARVETSLAAPDWPESAERPEDETGLFYTTPYLRETYLIMRARNSPVLCVQAHQGATVCVQYDPTFDDAANTFYTSSS